MLESSQFCEAMIVKPNSAEFSYNITLHMGEPQLTRIGFLP